MRADRREVGQRGEDAAAAALAEAGYEVLLRNWRCPAGEVDIVARQGEVLVLVEVRARRGRRYGLPEESITAGKRATLLACGRYLAAELEWEGPWRVDVVAIEMGPAGMPGRVSVIRHAVED